jgi:hypothetical protein
MSSNGVNGWTVTGTFPKITVTPSIGSSGYHGFIRDGYLEDDLEGRAF